MQTISSIASVQRWSRAQRKAGCRIGFVPTMGCLHEGHLSLVRKARKLVGPTGRVAVSIYVNPTQFGPKEDFSRYPRPLARDLRLCREAGVDLVFVPTDAAMYAGREQGRYSTYVVEESLTQPLEGASRPTHFRGVTTVVAKLFNIVQPDVAVFGEKDFQQAAVLRRMVVDLNFPLRMVVAPTFREPDGLAMSSRNQYLNPSQRAQATALWQAIQQARAVVRLGPVPAAKLGSTLRKFIERQPEARVDYVALVDPETLQPVAQAARGTRLLLAVFVGTTRLIDNAGL